MDVEHFEIVERFCGPPRSGNGGYTCGRVAAHLQGPVAVRLKAPPPLLTALRLESTDGAARLFHAEALIAEARRVPLDLDVPAGPSRAEAVAASRSYAGFHGHAFPRCFVCGPAREPRDGLRIFAGHTGAPGLLAAPWMPDASLADTAGRILPEFLWSALDCPGAFAVLPPVDGMTVVLGELCAEINGEVMAGEDCVVAAWPLGVEGRRHFAGSAVYGTGGRLLARARAAWIAVPSATWT
jgi:hypothetical protein